MTGPSAPTRDGATQYGLAFSAGLQDAGVVPTVKHLPGQGRSTADTHREPAVVPATVDELRSSDLLPFQRVIDAGAPVTDGRQAVRTRDALVAAVESGALAESRLSEAAARVTALAGGDPRAMSCLDVDVPVLDVPVLDVPAAGVAA